MKNFALALFVIVTLASTCHARKKCDSVCPDHKWPLDETVVQTILVHFQCDGPEDGVCLDGKQKYLLYGSDFGYEENRCICVPNPNSQYSECGNEIPKCAPMPTVYADELARNFFLRVGRDLINEPSDGCCPCGSIKWIAEPEITGADRNLCFCIPQDDLVLN